jgi:hypothetical protein
MGIMDLLGKASGASGFGSAFGRSVYDNGMVLGKTLFMGHGTNKSSSEPIAKMFEDADAMRSAGFELFCPDVDNWRPLEESNLLANHCYVAGMAIAAHLGIFCATFLSRESNKSDFNRALGAGTADKIRAVKSGITVELLQSYMAIRIPAGLKLVNENVPGEGDLVGFFMGEVVRHCATYPIGFQRSGVLGFGKPALSLMNDTIKGFEDAIAKFHW